MIIDSLQHLKQYVSCHHRLQQAEQFLTGQRLETLEPGRYDIDGDAVFALVQQYETKPREQGVWEGHEKYLDVQYIVEGEEQFGYATKEHASVSVTRPYDADADYALFSAEGSFFTLQEGHFVVALPQDLHMPGIAADQPKSVKKIVVKIMI